MSFTANGTIPFGRGSNPLSRETCSGYFAEAPKLSGRTHLANRPYLNTACPTSASGGDPRRPLERLVQVLAIQKVVSGKLLLRFREWTVHNHYFAILHADGGGRDGRLEWLSAPENAQSVRLRHNSPVFSPDSLLLFRREGVRRLLIRVDQQH